ncbi:MAG: hypothetical protein Q8N59_01540 [bacterium]|nr:hypothetical protein [bacterium]
MTTNELKVLEVIWDWGGEASVDIIAREVRVSIDYARLLGESLKKEGCIDFLRSKLCKIKSKGKMELVKRNIKSSSKIVVNGNLSNLGRNKKEKLIVGY